MLLTLRKKMKNQQGFTLIELMVVIAILGILAAIAIPKFTNATNSANVAKIQADLSIIDTAIAMEQANTPGTAPTGAVGGNLVTNGYLTTWPTNPAGTINVSIDNAAVAGVTSTAYTVSTTAPYRAIWATYHAEDIAVSVH